MLELRLGKQQSGTVTGCSFLWCSCHSGVARFGTFVPVQRPKLKPVLTDYLLQPQLELEMLHRPAGQMDAALFTIKLRHDPP